MSDSEEIVDVKAEIGLYHELVDQIGPLLSGQPVPVIGAVLADLVAIFIAGHHPNMRQVVLANIIQTVRAIIPLTVDQMIAEGHAPPDWRGETVQ